MRFVYLTVLCLACFPLVSAFPVASDTSHTFVIVHGAWGGGYAYQDLAARLEVNGHRVYRPTLTGLGERVHLASPDVNLDTHIQDIVHLLEYEDLHHVVLVGHSYGGVVITGVADRVPERIARAVYVDAMLPADGEAALEELPDWFRERLIEAAETYGNGWQIPPPQPGPRTTSHPLATLRQRIALQHEFPPVPGRYILTREPDAETDDFSGAAERARSYGWPVWELPTGHNPHVTMPDELVELLFRAAE